MIKMIFDLCGRLSISHWIGLTKQKKKQNKHVSSSDPRQLALYPTHILTFCLTCLSNIPCDIYSGMLSCMSHLNHILK